jgi:ssDNA thymidine ADP-ribosyltransferase, DarT
MLADYVPFYFAPRSPMLFTISRGNVEGYSDGQRPIVHLVSSVEAISGLASRCCFTDGHADMTISQFSDDLTQLQKMIDWKLMKSRYWNDTSEQPDRKRRRQAEFLVHKFFPWAAVKQIGVYNREVGSEVEYILLRAQDRPMLVTEPSWYY